MKTQENASLQDKSTFRLPARARYFVEIRLEEDLREFLADDQFEGLPIFILGDGSNTVFTHDFAGVVLHVQIKGREVVEETPDEVIVELGVGEN